MPDNKSQHYVPRCHLKPFSANREGVAINLFNHGRHIIRENVPINGQCAKSYFYGEDLVIENLLQKLEGQYASTVRLIERDEQFSDSDAGFLRSFAFLQWYRTDAALRRRRESMIMMEKMARRGLEHLCVESPDLSQRAMVSGSLKIWTATQNDLGDLRVLILRNRSGVDFITSDDPAAITNRVFLQRMQDNNFGIANIGLMLLMPLGPRYALICYDHDCYVPVGRTGRYVNVNREKDADAFNEIQFLNSVSNIYFAGPIRKAERVAACFKAISHLRLSARFRVWEGISEGVSGEFECFRRLKDGEDFDPRIPRLQSLAPLYPRPAHWMSNFAMRPRITGWVKPGVVMGPVRSSRAKELRGMTLTEIGIGPLPGHNAEVWERMYERLSEEQLARFRSSKVR